VPTSRPGSGTFKEAGKEKGKKGTQQKCLYACGDIGKVPKCSKEHSHEGKKKGATAEAYLTKTPF